MPIKVPAGLPALQTVMDNGTPVEELRASTGDTLHIALLNLMPMKESTEADFIRVLASSPLEIELTLMKLDTHTPKHATAHHMQSYYKGFGELSNTKFDGLIITGAPIEKIEFEEVTYWDELREIIDWAQDNVTSTLFICWAAQAGLYYKFGIRKHLLPKKMFGVFPHAIHTPSHPLFEGIGTTMNVPHSRHTELRREDIVNEARIELLAESDESGVHIMQERGTRNFFVTGHSEYALTTLDEEYRRDVSRGLEIEPPLYYYTGNNPSLAPLNSWQDDARKFFGNWLQYFAKNKISD